MKYIVIAFVIVFALTVKATYSQYLIATCITDTECQAADGQEI